MTKAIDWLAQEALAALADNPALNEGWFTSKRGEQRYERPRMR